MWTQDLAGILRLSSQYHGDVERAFKRLEILHERLEPLRALMQTQKTAADWQNLTKSLGKEFEICDAMREELIYLSSLVADKSNRLRLASEEIQKSIAEHVTDLSPS